MGLELKKLNYKIMYPRKLLLLVLSLTTVGAWAQGSFGNLPKTVDVRDVEIISIDKVVFSSHDSIVVNPVTGKVDTLIIDDGMRIATAEDEAYFTEASGPARAPHRAPAVTPDPSLGGVERIGLQWAKTGAYLYTYKYPSVDADGNRVILSSLMGVPRRQFQIGFAKPNNVLIACHETITSNFEAPTNYKNEGGDFQSGVGMMLQYARYDRVRQPCCLVIMPDYEGYGITADRAHPYLYQELTARQVVDAVRYGIALYNKESGFSKFESDWKSVSLGYSQGGSVALAVHKFIEENGLDEELHFAGSVCGDGPYDPVAHLLYYINDNGHTWFVKDAVEQNSGHEAGSVSMPIVMPLILKGMCDSNPLMRQHTVDDYLSGKFLSTGSLDMINAKKNPKKKDQFSTDDVSDRYRQQRKKGMSNFVTISNPYTGTGSFRLSFSAAEVREMFFKEADKNVHGKLQQMLTEECYNYFTTSSNFIDGNGKRITPTGRGFMQDLHRALESNNLTVGWKPKHRIAFYHSTFDTVVPYDNLLSFIKNQDDLRYFFYKDSDRHLRAGVNPSHTVPRTQADVFVYETASNKDHVPAGKDFFFFGSWGPLGITGITPDYWLYKWVLKGDNETSINTPWPW